MLELLDYNFKTENETLSVSLYRKDDSFFASFSHNGGKYNPVEPKESFSDKEIDFCDLKDIFSMLDSANIYSWPIKSNPILRRNTNGTNWHIRYKEDKKDEISFSLSETIHDEMSWLYFLRAIDMIGNL